MTRRNISRRGLVVGAIGGALAWVGGYASFIADRDDSAESVAGYRELITLCTYLRCPRTIGSACLLALSTTGKTQLSLPQTILADVRPTVGIHRSSVVFAQAIIERSRTDFRDGRVVTVGGWVLSLTETRVYALATLLAEQGEPVT